MGFWEDLLGQSSGSLTAVGSNTPDEYYNFNVSQLRMQQQLQPAAYAANWGSIPPEEAAARLVPNSTAGQAKLQAARDAEAEQQRQITEANAANAPPPPAQGPSAQQELEGLLPPGFDVTALPDAFTAPFVESTRAAGRSRAEDFISNMLKRGTLTEGGAGTARAALTGQDPAVRNRLTGIANTLLANERSKLRGIAGEGYTAAAGLPGESFDPSPYQQRVNTEVSSFTGGFPATFTGAVGDVGGLYDVGSLPSAGGAVTGPQNVQYDPYAFEGGKLPSTGGGAPQKKRTTSVF